MTAILTEEWRGRSIRIHNKIITYVSRERILINILNIIQIRHIHLTILSIMANQCVVWV